jgi:hypothetical protein
VDPPVLRPSVRMHTDSKIARCLGPTVPTHQFRPVNAPLTEDFTWGCAYLPDAPFVYADDWRLAIKTGKDDASGMPGVLFDRH